MAAISFMRDKNTNINFNSSHIILNPITTSYDLLLPLHFTLSVCLIPRPLLPGEKGSKTQLINDLAPLPWERGWGEADYNRGVGGEFMRCSREWNGVS